MQWTINNICNWLNTSIRVNFHKFNSKWFLVRVCDDNLKRRPLVSVNLAPYLLRAGLLPSYTILSFHISVENVFSAFCIDRESVSKASNYCWEQTSHEIVCTLRETKHILKIYCQGMPMPPIWGEVLGKPDVYKIFIMKNTQWLFNFHLNFVFLLTWFNFIIVFYLFIFLIW